MVNKEEKKGIKFPKQGSAKRNNEGSPGVTPVHQARVSQPRGVRASSPLKGPHRLNTIIKTLR